MTVQRQTVFVAGATGSMGVAAVDALRRAGHDVIGVSRSDEGDRALRHRDARPVRVDLFEEDALVEAMRGADAVVHFATKILSPAEGS